MFNKKKRKKRTRNQLDSYLERKSGLVGTQKKRTAITELIYPLQHTYLGWTFRQQCVFILFHNQLWFLCILKVI